MKTDWRKPFDRNATVLYHHDSYKVFARVSQPISDSGYRHLESVRQEWYDEWLWDINKADKEREEEIRVLKSRVAFLDTIAAHADEVYKVLDEYPRYATMQWWIKLKHWLDDHPRVLSSDDHALMQAEERLARITNGPPKPKKDFRSGVKVSAETRAKQSESAKRSWEKARASGNLPKVGRPKKEGFPTKEFPY